MYKLKNIEICFMGNGSEWGVQGRRQSSKNNKGKNKKKSEERIMK